MKYLCISFIVVFSFSMLSGQNENKGFSYIELAEVLPEKFNKQRLNDTGELESYTDEILRSIISKEGIDTKRITNQKRVLLAQEKELSDIFFSNKAVDGIQWAADCYIPRHVALFFDDEKSLLGVIEICIECSRVKTFGIFEKLDLDLRNEDFDRLEKVINEVFE